jgi:hypothetical protein
VFGSSKHIGRISSRIFSKPGGGGSTTSTLRSNGGFVGPALHEFHPARCPRRLPRQEASYSDGMGLPSPILVAANLRIAADAADSIFTR